MPGVQDLIAMAGKLGINPGAATAGAGGILSMIKQQAGEADLGKLTSAIPGLGDLMKSAPAAGGGGLLGKLGGMVGGGAGDAGALMGMLGKAGIGADKAPGFIGVVIDFLKSNVNPATLMGILGKVGALKSFLPK